MPRGTVADMYMPHDQQHADLPPVPESESEIEQPTKCKRTIMPPPATSAGGVRNAAAKSAAKAATKRTTDGSPVHSFQTLLADLATITRNRIQPNFPAAVAFDQIALPRALQQQALDLLGVCL